MKERENFMRVALEEAKKAFEEGEVPVGAVIVHEGKIIARAHNEVEQRKDATAHAEILCLKSAARYFGNWRLSNAQLYSTLEPCAMCAGALLLSRIETLKPEASYSSVKDRVGCFAGRVSRFNEAVFSREAQCSQTGD